MKTIDTHDSQTTSFQGEKLLEGVSPDQYRVFIGEELCGNVQVTMTSIICTPPKSPPSGLSQPTVKVRVSLDTSNSKLKAYFAVSVSFSS